MSQQVNIEYKNKLLKKIKTFFPEHEIITLSDIVKNISNCPSVRGGDKEKLDFFDYYEVGLRDCNPFGVIEIDPDSKRRLGAANGSMVAKYKLRKNDLLLPYKVSRQIKVARIEKEYDLPMVTNTSTTRIEMYEDAPKEMAIIIQSYLDLPYIQEYLISISRAHLQRRAPLKPQILLSLPIPRFDIDKNMDYSEIYNKHSEMEDIAKEIDHYSRKLRYSIDIYKETTAHLFMNSVKTASKTKKEDLINRMKKILKELEDIEDISYKNNEYLFEMFPEYYPFSRRR